MRLLALLPVLLAACGGEPAAPQGPDLGTHEGVTDAHIAALEEMADVADGIRDLKTAEAARPRMEALKRRMQEINHAEERLLPANPEERKRLDRKLEEAAERLEPRLKGTMERLKDDPALVVVAEMILDVTFESR
jgi:hypothetical protein